MTDANENESIGNFVKGHLDAKAHNTYTSLPAVIARVYGDGADQRIDVAPSVSRVLRTGEVRPLPVIAGVPVIFPGSITSQFTFPLTVGDIVLLVFSQSDIENFKLGDGRPAPALTKRKHAMQDAVAIPGLFPFNKAQNNPSHRTLPHNLHDAVIVHNIGTSGECEIRLKENGDVKVTTPTLFEVQCKDMKVEASNSISLKGATMAVDVPTSTWTGAITQSGDYTQTGAYKLTGKFDQTGIYTLGGKIINTHVHVGVMGGPSQTGTMP